MADAGCEFRQAGWEEADAEAEIGEGGREVLGQRRGEVADPSGVEEGGVQVEGGEGGVCGEGPGEEGGCGGRVLMRG